MYFLPNFPLSLNSFTIFGLVVFSSLIVGEIIARTKILPRISGYILLGFILGPNVLGIISKSVLMEMQAIIDVSLGLISFSIGRHLNFSWLKHDKGLLLTGIMGFGVTTSMVAAFIMMLGWSFTPALFAGIIATTTSPAVVLMVARDLSSEGPVTRRSLILISINNFLGVAIIAILIPFISDNDHNIWYIFLHSAYKLIGSLFLGLAFYVIIKNIARIVIGKQKELQLILLVSIIILAIATAKLFNFSNMLVLFSIGIAARNYDKKRSLMEIDFGSLSPLFFIPLFFTTGCFLEFSGFREAFYVIITFILLRFLGQLVCGLLFTKKSSLKYRQSILITLALTPMTGTAIGITNRVLEFSPEIGQQLLLIVSAAIGILGIFGPLATQVAFRKAGESFDTSQKN